MVRSKSSHIGNADCRTNNGKLFTAKSVQIVARPHWCDQCLVDFAQQWRELGVACNILILDDHDTTKAAVVSVNQQPPEVRQRTKIFFRSRKRQSINDGT